MFFAEFTQGFTSSEALSIRTIHSRFQLGLTRSEALSKNYLIINLKDFNSCLLSFSSKK